MCRKSCQPMTPSGRLMPETRSARVSGEVMEITTAVTPFILEYGAEHPAVYALELLPLYDAIARVKVRAHWQTDVLASFLIGTGIGYYAHTRSSSITVGVLPRGVTIGWKKSF